MAKFCETEIYQTILDNDVVGLKALIDSWHDDEIQQKDWDGRTYLHFSVDNNVEPDILSQLLKKIDITAKDENGYTAMDLLHLKQMSTNHQEIMYNHIRQSFLTNQINTLNHMLLQGWEDWPDWPAKADSLPEDVVRFLDEVKPFQEKVKILHEQVSEGKDNGQQIMDVRLIEAWDRTGLSVCHKIVIYSSQPLSQHFIKLIPDINSFDKMERSMLHYAAVLQDNHIYKQLVDAGANTNIKDITGHTPMDYKECPELLDINEVKVQLSAILQRPHPINCYSLFQHDIPCEMNMEPTSKPLLRRRKANRSLVQLYEPVIPSSQPPTQFHNSKLYNALLANDKDEAMFLMDLKETDYSLLSFEGWTYLHLAVANCCDADIIKCLLYHVNVSCRDEEGRTAVELALNENCPPDILLTILQHLEQLIITGDITQLEKLSQAGWNEWPEKGSVCWLQIPSVRQQFILEANRRQEKSQSLYKAIITGDLNKVTEFADRSTVICPFRCGHTALQMAVIYNNVGITQHILNNFPHTVSIQNNMGRTALHYAAGIEDGEHMFSLLLNAGCLENTVDLRGCSPTFYLNQSSLLYVKDEQLRIEQIHSSPKLLPSRWMECQEMEFESLDLYKAIIKGQIEDVRKLLDSGIDASIRDPKGKGLLHVAVEANVSADILKELLIHIDPVMRDINGNTVADIILENKLNDMEMVLKNHVKATILDATVGKLWKMTLSGWDMWPVTATDVQTDSMEKKMFIEDLPYFQKKVSDLHKAIQEGNLSEVKKLADDKLMQAADGTGLPPIHKAVVLGHADIVLELARSYKDCLKVVDNMKRSALHYAGGCHDAGYLYVELTNEGADDTLTDMAGKTPKDYFDHPEQLSAAQEKQRVLQILERIEKRQQAATKQDSPQRNWHSAPQPNTVDGIYVAEHLGSALTLALADIVERQPWDPIEYLANWLYKYKETLNFVKKQEDLLAEIQREESAWQREAKDRKNRKEEEKTIHEEELKKEREIEEEKRKEQEELQRKSKDAAFARRPSLETVKEEGEEDSSAREKDENGQTELHKLAAQQGTDLSALIRLGYSIADRDTNNKTARDIASDQGVTENVTAIDRHVHSMVETENMDSLQQLVLDGYDGLLAVLDNIDRDSLSDDMGQSLDTITNFQEKISEVLHIVHAGSVRDVKSALTRKKLVEAKDKYGRCPLHIAILSGKEDIVEHIVTTYPSSLKCRDNMNRTPLHYAMSISQSMADMLVSHGADQNYKDVKQRIPSYYSNNRDEILTLRETLSPLPNRNPIPENGEQEASQTLEEGEQKVSQSPDQHLPSEEEQALQTEQYPSETEQSVAE